MNSHASTIVFCIDLSLQALMEPLHMHINNAKLSIDINIVVAYKQYVYTELSFYFKKARMRKWVFIFLNCY